MEQLQRVAPNEPLVIVATGKYIGEGFDCPRLDTMFLALPVSWKGIIAQYAGRLHRDYEGKEEVRIYDYIDINVPVCDTMYRRRLKGYANVGYSLQPTGLFAEVKDADNLIYNGKTFLTPFLRNLAAVKRSIVIASPRINPGRHSQIVARLLDLVTQGIRITIYTRTDNEHTEPLSRHGAKIVIKENLTLTCTILDNARLWYGNVSPLTYQSETENIIPLHNPEIATAILNRLCEKT